MAELPHEPERRCAMCGVSLRGRRRHSRVCSGRCRANLSRFKRLSDGREVDGYSCVADWLRKRTEPQRSAA